MVQSLLMNRQLRRHVDTDFRVVADKKHDNGKGTSAGSLPCIASASTWASPSARPKFVAFGSSLSANLSPIHETIVRLSGRTRPNVLYIGTAFFDRTDKYLIGTHALRTVHKCPVVRLRVSDPKDVPPLETMRRLVLDWAHVILCSGGNSLHALLRWKDVGLDLLLRDAALRGSASGGGNPSGNGNGNGNGNGIVLCGGSAGGACWFTAMQSDSLKPEACLHSEEILSTLSPEELSDWSYVNISCLGFLPVFCVPHYDIVGTNGVKRKVCAKDALLRMDEVDDTNGSGNGNNHANQGGRWPTIALGIDEKAAIVVDGANCSVISADGIATCHLLARIRDIDGREQNENVNKNDSIRLLEMPLSATSATIPIAANTTTTMTTTKTVEVFSASSVEAAASAAAAAAAGAEVRRYRQVTDIGDQLFRLPRMCVDNKDDKGGNGSELGDCDCRDDGDDDDNDDDDNGNRKDCNANETEKAKINDENKGIASFRAAAAAASAAAASEVMGTGMRMGMTIIMDAPTYSEQTAIRKAISAAPVA